MNTTKLVLNIVAIVLVIVGIVKVSIIGYYPREAPLYFGMLVVALVLFFIASKIGDRELTDEEMVKMVSSAFADPGTETARPSDSWDALSPAVTPSTAVAATAKTNGFCGQCGSAVTSDAEFCGMCGTRVPR